MYYNDGVRVNWTDFGPAHAKGYADVLNGISLADDVKSADGTLKKRWYMKAYERGDGNPHQKYKFTQASPTFTCDQDDCNVPQ